MSLYVFDTDTLSRFERASPEIRRRMEEVGRERVAITVITVREQVEGRLARLNKAKTPAEIALFHQRLSETVSLLGRLTILPFTEAAIARFAALRVMKLNLGAMDLRIAAIAMESDAIVVTCNRRDFARVPGLMVEDWTVPV